MATVIDTHGAMVDDTQIADKLKALRIAVAKAAKLAERPAGSVRLMAVSKTVGEAGVMAALAAGQRLFGENRVQEAAAKWPAVKAVHPDIELHLIGPLQTNKIREALRIFDVIETIDREKLARAIARVAAEEGKTPGCFIEVNIGGEPQKPGVAIGDLGALVHLVRDELGLDLRGLMCVPPKSDHPGPYFGLLGQLARRHGLRELSMGMSGDFPAAILAGSTMVRIGTGIFGQR